MGSPPAIIENEIKMLDNPDTLALLFVEYQDVFNEPYIGLIMRNWLRTDRLFWEPREIKGITYMPWFMPYSWRGDLNHDGIVNFIDFAIAAKHYK